MNRAERFWQSEAVTSLGDGGGSPAAAIAVERLTKLYSGHAAVNGVSFAAPAGSIVGLLGGNGAGKTTTIAMIMGLVIPTRGSVSVLGHDMTRARDKVLHRMNFQSPYVPLPGRLTVRQNLTVFGRLYGVERLRDRIDELVDAFALATVLDRQTAALSAGQRTRVALAKAFINRPEVLLLDEPTASLDPDRAEWVRDRLIEYRQVRKATILLSSHNMAEVERLCDLVVVLSAGRIADMGSPRELMQRHSCVGLEEVFLRLVRYDETWYATAD